MVEGRPKLLERLARGEAVDVGGYRIGARMAAELQALVLERALARGAVSIQVDIVKIARRYTTASSEAGAPAMPGPRVTLCQAMPFWQEPRYYDPHQPAFVAASAGALQATGTAIAP